MSSRLRKTKRRFSGSPSSARLPLRFGSASTGGVASAGSALPFFFFDDPFGFASASMAALASTGAFLRPFFAFDLGDGCTSAGCVVSTRAFSSLFSAFDEPFFFVWLVTLSFFMVDLLFD